MELVIAEIAHPLAVQPTQFGLQVQLPDLRIIHRDIPLLDQAIDDRIEHAFSDERPGKRALRLDCGGLRTSHAGSAEQGPESFLSGQRPDLALDARGQPQTGTDKAEVTRHGGPLAIGPGFSLYPA
ncbi:hypothetical protein D9M70_617430 [compost metagenome]